MRLNITRRQLCLIIFCGFLSTSVTTAGTAQETARSEKAEKPKLREVKVKDVVFKVPEGWKEEKPKSRMRAAQFAIPKAKGDAEKTELAVFVMPGGGTFARNLPRWTREFRSGSLKVKAHKGKCPQGEYTITELTGVHVGSSFAPRPKPLENGAMVTLILLKDGRAPYYLKMTGPANSVKEATKSLRRAIDADVKKEKPVEL